MHPRSFFMTAVPVALLLWAAPGALGWHWQDEVPYGFMGGVAGDPRVVEDGASCFALDVAKVDAHCVILYAQPTHRLGVNAHAMNLVRPAECMPDLETGIQPIPVAWWWNEMRFRVAGHATYETLDCDEPFLFARAATYRPVALHPDVPIRGHWVLSSDILGGAGAALGGIGALPCLTVAMTLWANDETHTLRSIAAGETTKTVISAPLIDGLSTPVPDPCPGADGTVTLGEATEFVVEMGTSDAHFAGGLLWHVRWYQWDGDGVPEEDAPVSQTAVRVRTGSEHVPRLVAAVTQPYSYFTVLPHAQDARLFLELRTGSPWGIYDLDLPNVRLLLTTTDGDDILPAHATPGPPGEKNFLDHASLNGMRFTWDVLEEGLPEGNYQIRVLATNWQHSGDAEWTATLRVSERGFTLETPDGTTFHYQELRRAPGAEMPAIGVFPLVVLGVAAALRVARRRAGSK